MKRTNQKLNNLGKILLAVLIFLCGFNVTYAYFTARATAEGDLTFYDLAVTWGYTPHGSEYKDAGSTALTIYPNTTSPILRGVTEFGFQTAATSATAIDDIGVNLSANSCNSYVRVKIEAYRCTAVGTRDTSDTTNYGAHIELTSSTATKGADGYYYYNQALTKNNPTNPTRTYHILATKAKVLATAPATITDGYLEIVLKFEAVQANKAAAVAQGWNIPGSLTY